MASDISIMGPCAGCGGSPREPNYDTCERCRLVYFVMQVRDMRENANQVLPIARCRLQCPRPGTASREQGRHTHQTIHHQARIDTVFRRRRRPIKRILLHTWRLMHSHDRRHPEQIRKNDRKRKPHRRTSPTKCRRDCRATDRHQASRRDPRHTSCQLVVIRSIAPSIRPATRSSCSRNRSPSSVNSIHSASGRSPRISTRSFQASDDTTLSHLHEPTVPSASSSSVTTHTPCKRLPRPTPIARISIPSSAAR